MFYATTDHHGLKHNPFNALIVPRPIGWISSQDSNGRVNLAPYSFFNGVAYNPPQVMFSATGPHREGGDKDSLANIREIGEFVVNLATWELREQMNLTAAPAPRGTDEFEVAGLTKAPSRLVAPPRVAESPVHLECRLVKQVDLLTDETGDRNVVTFGHVVGIHIDERIIKDGVIDIHVMNPISRLGGKDYARVTEVFAMTRPSWPVEG